MWQIKRKKKESKQAKCIQNRKKPLCLTYAGTKSLDNLSKITQALRVTGGHSEQAESHGVEWFSSSIRGPLSMLVLNWILSILGCSCKLGLIFIVEGHELRSCGDLEGNLNDKEWNKSGGRKIFFSEADFHLSLIILYPALYFVFTFLPRPDIYVNAQTQMKILMHRGNKCERWFLFKGCWSVSFYFLKSNFT